MVYKETYIDVYNSLSEKQKEAIKDYQRRKINEYELADLLDLEYTQIGAFILVNGIGRKNNGKVL